MTGGSSFRLEGAGHGRNAGQRVNGLAVRRLVVGLRYCANIPTIALLCHLAAAGAPTSQRCVTPSVIHVVCSRVCSAHNGSGTNCSPQGSGWCHGVANVPTSATLCILPIEIYAGQMVATDGGE
jgi:hypothetical protein